MSEAQSTEQTKGVLTMKKTKKLISILLTALSLISLLGVFSIGAYAATPMTEVNEQNYVLLKNAKTGEYLNFDNGVLKNNTPVRCWPKDGSTEQIWAIKKNSNGTYRIVTYKSANYCLDVYRGNSALKAGQLVDIWKNGNDTTAQNVCFYKCSNGNWIICMASNTSLAISSNGSKKQLKLVKFDTSNTAMQWIPTDKNGVKFDITKCSDDQPKAETPKVDASLNFVMPLKSSYKTNKLTQAFGAYYSKYGYHLGIDLGTTGNNSSTVHAICDGTVYKVLSASKSGGWGNFVIIQHKAPDGRIFYSGYGHMKDNSIVVKAGQTVKAGDKIGTMGNTGYSSGPHLHLLVMSGSISKNTIPQGYSDSRFNGSSVKYKGIVYYDPLKVIETNGTIIK